MLNVHILQICGLKCQHYSGYLCVALVSNVTYANTLS